MANTIKDVARRAGVSTATVSLVLSDRPGVRISQATRERVRRAADELDFRPNMAARSLISGKTQVIGLVASDLSSPLVARIIHGVEQEARERHYHVLVCEARQPDEEMDTVRWLRARGIDALVMASATARGAEIAEYLRRENVPSVLVNQEGGNTSRAIIPEHRAVGSQAATLFLDAGYRRLAFFGCGPSRASNERMQAFLETAAARDASVILRLTPDFPDWNGQAEAAGDLYRGSGDNWKAALCYNDVVAFGVMEAARNAGRRIPEDLAIIGVDNLPFSAFPRPALATFDLNMGEIGRQAVAALLDEDREPGITRVAPTFIPRASCGRVTR